MNALRESIIKFHTLPLPSPPLCSIGNSNFKTASLYKKISEIEIEIRDRTSFRHGPLKETAQLQAAHKSIRTQRSQGKFNSRKIFLKFEKVCI